MKNILILLSLVFSSNLIFSLNTPIQSSPANGSVNQNLSLSLMINKVTGATYYDYQLDTVPTFNSAYLKNYTHTDAYSGQSVYDLFYGQKFYWRVRGRNSTDTSNWSSTWNFTTKNYGVTQLSPVDNSTDVNVSVSLMINQVTGSENYDYQLDTVPTFNSAYLKNYTHTDAYSGKTVSDLFYGQKFYWRVRGRNSTDTSNWSSTWNFTTKNYGVTQLSPVDNSTNVNVSVSLMINQVTGSENYDYQLDTVQTFNSTYLKNYTHTDAYSGKTVSDLFYGQKFYWRVRGRNGADTSSWSSTWNFTTKNYGATPSSPANMANSISINPTLYINTVNGSENYDYQLDTTINFNSAFLQNLTHSGSYSGIATSGLRYGTTYYWHVRGRNDADTSVWSNFFQFTTNFAITAPTLINPQNDSVDVPLTSVNLVWESLPIADSYQYQVSENSDFSSIFKTGNTTLTYTTISNLYPSTTYYWRVRAENEGGYSNWTSIWHFTTEAVFLEAPLLISPSNNTVGESLNPTLTWNSVFGANNYTLQIAPDITFSTFTEFSTSNISYQIIGLSENETYFWRINATNGLSTSSWSDIWQFSTGIFSNCEESVKKSIHIFPNPINSFVNIENIDYQSIKITNIQLIDISGTIISNFVPEFNNRITIDLSEHPSGFYFLTLFSDTKTLTYKLIKD